MTISGVCTTLSIKYSKYIVVYLGVTCSTLYMHSLYVVVYLRCMDGVQPIYQSQFSLSSKYLHIWTL